MFRRITISGRPDSHFASSYGGSWPNSAAIYDEGFAGAGTPPEPFSSSLFGGGVDVEFGSSSTTQPQSYVGTVNVIRSTRTEHAFVAGAQANVVTRHVGNADTTFAGSSDYVEL